METTINIVILILIYALYLVRRWKGLPVREFIVNTLMYIYISMVLYVTVMPITIPTFSINNLFLSAANFVPFRDIILGHGGAMRDIVLNIIMMMPFGFLLSVIRKQGLIKTIFYTFLFSLAIESTQLISPWIGGITFRSFDVTDLITNTTGGAVGYIIFLVLRPVVDKVMGR